MGQELVGNRGLLGIPRSAHRRFATRLRHQHAVARRKFLHLAHVVGEALRRRIDRGQPAADHHHRQPHLQIRDRRKLCRTGQLQRHQGKSRPARTPRARPFGISSTVGLPAPMQRDVVEAHRPERHPSPSVAPRAETHAAEMRKPRTPLQQQPHQLQIVLVPAHRDAVLGDAAEPGHHPIIQVLVQRFRVAHRDTRIEAQRLDLQPIDRHHRVPVIHQVMRQGKPRRSQPDHQHLAPAVRPRQRTRKIQRIPTGQQRVDLDPPGQAKHVLQHRGLGLRNVDRFLTLEDARLHAVVADTMPGCRHHRVVDGDRCEGAQHAAVGAQHVHLADLLIQRATGERHAERRFLERTRLAVAQSLGTGILALLVAPDAVVHLVQRLRLGHAPVGQCEPVAGSPVVLRQAQRSRAAVALDRFDRHQVQRIDPVRHAEQCVARVRRPALPASASPRAA